MIQVLLARTVSHASRRDMQQGPPGECSERLVRECCGVPGREPELKGLDSGAPIELAVAGLGFTTVALPNCASQASL